MTRFTGRTGKAFVLALIALLVVSLPMAAPAAADVDQCAPPGVQSASAAAHQPGRRCQGARRGQVHDADRRAAGRPRRRRAAVEHARLTVGTLSDAPPNIFIDP